MNTYQVQEFNSTIAFITSIVMMGFMVGMVKPSFSEEKHHKLSTPKATVLNVTELEEIRDIWLQTTQGRRYTELLGMIMKTPSERTEYLHLIDIFNELGMTAEEKIIWRKEGAELERMDIEEKEEDDD